MKARGLERACDGAAALAAPTHSACHATGVGVRQLPYGMRIAVRRESRQARRRARAPRTAKSARGLASAERAQPRADFHHSRERQRRLWRLPAFVRRGGRPGNGLRRAGVPSPRNPEPGNPCLFRAPNMAETPWNGSLIVMIGGYHGRAGQWLSTGRVRSGSRQSWPTQPIRQFPALVPSPWPGQCLTQAMVK